MLIEEVCFQCRLGGFNCRKMADMKRERFPLFCFTVTKTLVTMCYSDDRNSSDTVIRERAWLTGWDVGEMGFKISNQGWTLQRSKNTEYSLDSRTDV